MKKFFLSFFVFMFLFTCAGGTAFLLNGCGSPSAEVPDGNQDPENPDPDEGDDKDDETSGEAAINKHTISFSSNTSASVSNMPSNLVISMTKTGFITTGPNGETLYHYTGSANLPTNVPTRSGYTFVGWTQNANNTGSVYSPGERYSTGGAAQFAYIGSETLYAKWEAEEFHVEFWANYMDDSRDITLTYGESFTTLSLSDCNGYDWTRPHYTIVGWSTSPTGGVEYDLNRTYTFTGSQDLNLYAVWRKNTYSLSIVYASTSSFSHATAVNVSCSKNTANNVAMGATLSNFVSLEYNSSISISFIKTNYTGNYNYYLSIGSTPNTSSNENVLDYTWVATGNKTITLYVYEKYEIRYFNGGTSVQTQNKVHGANVTLATNNLTKAGHTPNGWNSSSDGSGTHYANGATFSENNYKALYAEWIINSYTLTINPNGGSYNGSSSTRSVTQNYGTTYSLQAPTRSGYTFAGWTKQDDRSQLDGLKAWFFAGSHGSVGVYNNQGNGTVTHTNVSDSSTSTGYSLKITTNGNASPYAGGFNHSTSTAANELYVHFFRAKIPVGYEVHDHSNSIGTGGSFTWLTSRLGTGKWETYAYLIQTGSSGSFSSTGFISVGGGNITNVTWWLAESMIYKVSSNGTFHFQDRNETVVAVWSPNIYKITLDNQGATNAGTANVWYEFNTVKSNGSSNLYFYTSASCNSPISGGNRITAPTRTGYTFAGYFSGRNGTGTQYVDSGGYFINARYTTVGDGTLYAHWTVNRYYININVYMPDRTTEPYQTGDAGYLSTVYYSDEDVTYHNVCNERGTNVAYGSTIVFTEFNPGMGMKFDEVTHTGAGNFVTNTPNGGKYTFTVGAGDANISFYTAWDASAGVNVQVMMQKLGESTWTTPNVNLGAIVTVESANRNSAATPAGGTSTGLYSFTTVDHEFPYVIWGYDATITVANGVSDNGNNCKFVGFSNVEVPPSSSFGGTYTFTPSQNSTTTVYVWVQELSANQLKYDPEEDFYYFENGEFPQDAANIVDYATTLEKSGTISGASYTYDRVENILTLNGAYDGLDTLFVTETFNVEQGRNVRLNVEFLGGKVTGGGRTYFHWWMKSNGSNVMTDPGAKPSVSESDTYYDVAVAETLSNVYFEIAIWRNPDNPNMTTFSNAKFRITLEYDMDSILNEAANDGLTVLDSISYVDETGKKQSIPIYAFEGKKYARATAGNGVTKWFKVQPIRWRVNETVKTFSGTNFETLGREFMYTDKLTMNLWAYKDNWSTIGFQRIISCTEAGGWNIESDNGKISFACFDGGSGTYKNPKSNITWDSLSSGWHMFTLTFDGSYARGYLDGVLIATGEKFTGKIKYNKTNAIFVGAEAAGNATVPENSPFFQGKIKNVKILNKAYNQQEVASLFATGGLQKGFEDFGHFEMSNQDFTVISDKVLGFGAVLGLDKYGNLQHAKEGWNFSDSDMAKQVSSTSFGTSFASTKEITLKGGFTPAGTQKVVDSTWTMKLKSKSAYLSASGTSYSVIPDSETFSYFKVQRWNGGSFIDEPFGARNNEKYNVTFTKDSSVKNIHIGFNGRVSYDAMVDFDISHLANGTYTFQVEVSNFTVNGKGGSFSILNATTGNVRVASMEEINNTLGDTKAKATDLVAFLSSWGETAQGGDVIEYWTSSLGNQLDTARTINMWGAEDQAWLQNAMGVRFSMTMSSGINLMQTQTLSNAGDLICHLDYRDFTKVNGGFAIVATAYYNGHTRPLLISTDPEAVKYTTDHDSSVFSYDGKLVVKGITYYYSGANYGMPGVLDDTSVNRLKRYEAETEHEAAYNLLCDFLGESQKPQSNQVTFTTKTGWEVIGQELTVAQNTTYTLSVDFESPVYNVGHGIGLACIVSKSAPTNSAMEDSSKLDRYQFEPNKSGHMELTFNTGSNKKIWISLNGGYIADDQIVTFKFRNWSFEANGQRTIGFENNMRNWTKFLFGENIEVDKNLYNPALNTTMTNLTLDPDTDIFSINHKNTSSGWNWANFFMPFTNSAYLKPSTTYTIVVEAFDVVSGGKICPLSSYSITSYNIDIGSTSADIQITGNGIYHTTFTTAANFNQSTYNFRSYVEIPAGGTVNMKFRISVLEGNADIDDSFEYQRPGAGIAGEDLPNGYSELEYIESEGTQWIDTGVKPTGNTRVFVDWQYTDLAYQSRIVGCRDNPTFELYISGVGKNSLAWKDGDGQWASSGSTADKVRRTYDLDGQNKTYKIDGGRYANYSLDSYTMTQTSSNNLVLFGTNNNGTVESVDDQHLLSKAKLYACRIYETGQLVRDFVPCRRNFDGEVGLYDRVTGRFFGNAGTGSFIAGGSEVGHGRADAGLQCKNFCCCGNGEK